MFIINIFNIYVLVSGCKKEDRRIADVIKGSLVKWEKSHGWMGVSWHVLRGIETLETLSSACNLDP